MGLSERKIRQHQELKNQIIECSRAIVNNEGWSSLSIRKIADAIEYSVPVIYKHFENKEAIANYFITEGFSIMSREIKSKVDAKADISLRFQQLAHAYYDFALQYPKQYEIMFGVGIPTCEFALKNKEVGELSDYFFGLIKELIDKSGKKDIDVHMKFRSLWSILHGTVAFELLSIPQRESICPTKVLEDVVSSYTESILK